MKSEENITVSELIELLDRLMCISGRLRHGAYSLPSCTGDAHEIQDLSDSMEVLALRLGAGCNRVVLPVAGSAAVVAVGWPVDVYP